MSYLINNDKEILIEGISLINKCYPGYDHNTMYDHITKEYYSLEMILNSLDEYNLKGEFLKIVIFDFLIGNTDRHQNNWAVLEVNDTIRLCPMYDNGSSLCCYLEEDSVDSYLGNDKVRFNSLIDSKSKSRIKIDKKKKQEPTNLEVLQYVEKNFRECVADLIRNINEYISEESLNEIMLDYPVDIISNKRQKLIKMFILEKVKLMNNTFSREEGKYVY